MKAKLLFALMLVVLAFFGSYVLYFTADKIAAYFLGIDYSPPFYPYSSSQEFGSHAILTTLIDAGGFILILFGFHIGIRPMKLDEAFKPTKWGSRIANGYAVMILIAIILGFFAGIGIVDYDSITVFSWFILFPLYILVDSTVNRQFLKCPIRAALLPATVGFTMILVGFLTGRISGNIPFPSYLVPRTWPNSFNISAKVGIFFIAISLISVGIARVIRNR